MNPPILLFVSCLAAACTAAASPAVPSAADAVRTAEAFVARHGYTEAGHPPDQPVERTSLYDGLFGTEEVVAQRKGRVHGTAACVRTHDDGSHSVLFQARADAEEYWFVDVTPGRRPYVGHQTVRRSADCVDAPAR